ncbi:MAG: 50S ribosomal protein L29 [Brevinematia bacterium]
MKRREIKELRDLSDSDLKNVLLEVQNKLRDIRFKSKIERPNNPMEIRNLKRKIAVIKTIMRERELKV